MSIIVSATRICINTRQGVKFLIGKRAKQARHYQVYILEIGDIISERAKRARHSGVTIEISLYLFFIGERASETLRCNAIEIFAMFVYWRASEASETPSGVTNENRRYIYIYIYGT